MNSEVLQSLSCNTSSAANSSIAFPVRRVSSLIDLLTCKEGSQSSLKRCKSEGNISSTEFVISFDVSKAHEASVKECTGQQLHISDSEEELQSTIDETVEKCKFSIHQKEPEVREAENSTAVETAQTTSEVNHEALQSVSCSESSAAEASIAFPVRRVASLTDLLKCKEGRKSSLKLCKSEGNISSISFDFSQAHEALVKECTGQQLHICDSEEELQSTIDETVKNGESSMNQTEPEVKKGDKIDTQVEQDDQNQNAGVVRSMPNEQRRRSYSDSMSLKTPSVFTAKHLRKTKSYTTFPHIDTHLAPTDDKLSSFVHRTSCFRIMPHLSEGSFVDQDFPTVPVLSLSSQFESYPLNVACEVSSESEDSEREEDANEESVLHSWRKPSYRSRSHSEPVSTGPEPRARTWSLPNIEKKHLRFQETMHKAKTFPSRLRFPEQALEKLKEETNLSSRGHSSESVRSRSSSVMSLVDNWDSEFVDQLSSSQESLKGEEVMGHWINRNRRPSITKRPSFSLVKEVDEEKGEENEGDLQKTPSAVSLVNQVTEQVLSSHEVNVSSESGDDRSTTVEAAVKLWKGKESGRRATLASISPLTDSPKYASEIEQQAFRKIKKWKDSFALKLNNVLGERFKEMAAKREEELARKKEPRVLKVPMNLSDKEMGQLRNKLLLELKRKSIGNHGHEDYSYVPPPPSLPIPRVKFPRRTSTDQNPADLRAQMMRELSRRVSCVADDEEALHCCKPSSLVPDLSRTSLQTKPQRVVYIPSGIGSRTLDPDSIRDLLSWHEAERKRLKAELEGLPQAESGEKQVLIDRDDANKVLQSMMKIMEEIFTGTMKRFMGSGEPVSNVDLAGNVETKQTEECQMKEDDIDESDSRGKTVKPGKDLKLNTDVSNISTSGGTESLSSESTAELFSSESSLTGISFSSSNEAFGICGDQLNNASSSTAMKDNVTDMPANNTLECPSTSLEDGLAASNVSLFEECESINLSSHSLVSGAKAEASDNNQLVRIESIQLLLEDSQEYLKTTTPVTSVEASSKQFPKSSQVSEEKNSRSKATTNGSKVVEKSREYIEQHDETIVNNNQKQIQKLQEALQQKTESEDLLKQRLDALKNDLNSAENNSDYWFNQCVKKREKIEQLLSNARDMNSSNFELRQEINNKSRTIDEKDQEIQKLIENKTETEMLLQEVKEKLFKANKETERLKMLVRKYDEEKLRAVRADQMLQLKSLKPIALYGKSLESQKYKVNEKGGFYTTHKGTEGDTISSRNGKVLLSEVKTSECHFGPVSSFNVDTKPPSMGDTTVIGTNVKRKSAIRYKNVGNEVIGAPLSDEYSSLRDSPMLKDPEKTKKAIREWLTEVIRQAKTKLSRERKLVSYNEGTSTDGRLKRSVSEKEDARSSLREVVSSFKEKISKDVPRLRKQRKKFVSSYSTVPKTSRHDRQETPRPSRPFALTPTDAKEGSKVEPAADVSLDTFDSMEPFADVFLTNFESLDVLSADGIESVEPFSEVFIPWQDSEDAELKWTMEALEPTVTITKQYPDKKVHLGNFLLSSDARNISLEEKKAATQTAVPTSEIIRNIQDGFLKGVHPERKPKQGTEDNTTHTDRTSVIKLGQDKTTVNRKVEHYKDNRQLFPQEKRPPNQSVPSSTKSLQGSSVTHARAIIDSVAGTQRDDSLGFVMGTNEVIPFSNEFSTVESDIEHLIDELDSKTKSSLKLQREQQSSTGKVLQFKLDDSKLISSSGNGLIDSITVEIKLNKEQVMNEFANREMIKPQKTEEENTTLKAGKETPLTTNEHFAPDRLKHLTPQGLNQQRNETLVPFLYEKKNRSRDACKESNSYGAEFTKHRRIATQRWISDLLKSIGSVQTISELTENEQSKVRDKDREKVQSQSGELDSLAPSPNRPLHGSSIKELSLMNKQNISESNTQQSPKITLNQSVENDQFRKDSLEKKRPDKNVSCGYKGQQRKAEREVRLALWQEKNECLRGMLKDRNIQDSLVRKFSGRPKLSKTWTESSQLAKQTRLANKNPHLSRDSTKEEKDLNFLVDMYRSTKDVLSKQAEQEKAIQKCKNKVHFMTEEMETLQTKTTEEAMFEKGTKMASGKHISSVN